jgi:pimeloyl-ACP methyl ester carboxylesterase
MIERSWEGRGGSVGPEGMTLPEGHERTVKTDDGAELAVTILEPCEPTIVATPAADEASPALPAPAEIREPGTVVLAHGWTNARVIWAPVVRRLLAAQHRVVLYDQRGHGASTFGRQAPSPARLGRDLARLLDQLDLFDVVLAGHSMGGFSVMAFAGDHPDQLREQVRGLALVSTAAHGLGFGRLDPVAAWLFGSPTLSRMLVRPRLGLFLVRGVVGRWPHRAHLAITRELFLATDPGVRQACFREFGTMDLRPGLAHVAVPAVVVVGSRDTLTPPHLARAVASEIGGASFELIPDAGHMLPLEEPDHIAATITRLTASSDPRQ